MSAGIIFKVMPADDWQRAKDAGHYSGSADDVRDGFIHFSTGEQLAGTLAKHFAGQSDLVLISFPEEAFDSGLKWEASRGGAFFPHVYGAVDVGHATEVWSLTLDADGVPQIPDGVI